ncbi:twin-arginine translocase TatA/TatE family subunit [Marinilabiliaceae bacterium ANBcel2]|nr:twin-arginine translocase TatA/TatE family subunit [Marinilabiliaceae bacterium ANBcel2]
MGTLLFGISMAEIILLFLVVLMLFGSKKIPELARSLGKGMSEFRKAADEIKKEFDESTDEIKEDISEIEENIRQNSNEIRDIAHDVYREDYGTHNDPTKDLYNLDKPEESAPDESENKEEIKNPDENEIKEKAGNPDESDKSGQNKDNSSIEDPKGNNDKE